MLSSAEIIAVARADNRYRSSADGSWRVGLDRLVDAFNQEAALNPFGERHIAAVLADKLATRFAIDDWHVQHPEIADQKIERPVFGLGLPRTGSTALGVVLGQDRERRVLRTWEARQPCSPPEAATQYTGPWIASYQAELDTLVAADP